MEIVCPIGSQATIGYLLETHLPFLLMVVLLELALFITKTLLKIENVMLLAGQLLGMDFMQEQFIHKVLAMELGRILAVLMPHQ